MWVLPLPTGPLTPRAPSCSAAGPNAGRQRDLQQLPAQGPAGEGAELGGLGLPVRGEGLGCQACFSLQETQQIPTEEVVLEVLLSNGQRVKVTILTSDQTEDVLEVPELLCWVEPAPPDVLCGFPHVWGSLSLVSAPPALPFHLCTWSRVGLMELKSGS